MPSMITGRRRAAVLPVRAGCHPAEMAGSAVVKAWLLPAGAGVIPGRELIVNAVARSAPRTRGGDPWTSVAVQRPPA